MSTFLSPDYQAFLKFFHAPVYFPEFEENDRDFMYTLMRTFQHISHFARGFKGTVNLFGIVINLVHLRVLTRKAMRDSSVNIILAFMALSDTFAMIGGVMVEFSPELTMPTLCSPTNVFLTTTVVFILELVRRFFQKYSSYLSLLMATVRALVVKYVTESRFSGLSTPRFGFIVSFVQFAICILFAIPNVLSFTVIRFQTWIPPEYCLGFPENYSLPQFKVIGFHPDNVVYSYIEGITNNLVPCLLYPILTSVLALELRKAKKKSLAVGRDERRNERATKLIILMTISYMIAEIPQGIVFLMHPFYKKRYGIDNIFTSLKECLPLLSHINCCSHLILCMGMSSKYRETFYEVFGLIADPNSNAVELKIESSGGPSKTSANSNVS